ncbi:MAG: TldD/PmbA family protein [Holosporaceae bacterium]|jgi:PmbA protein|nr:TldD/PmbA family protein [Holosporaceae bacterium]
MDVGILEKVVQSIRKCGADQVDVLCSESNTISVTTRLAKLEKIVKSDITSVKMRVSIGKKSAIVSTDSLDELQKESFIEKVVSAAKNSPEEPVAFRPKVDQLCKAPEKIDICDPREVSLDELIAKAIECEEEALQVKGITNSEGAQASHFRSKFMLLKNNDFSASYEKTFNQLSIVTLAEKDGFLERDFDITEAIYHSDLKDAKKLAHCSAERTLKRLGAKKIKSCKVPVVFDRRVAGQLLCSLVEAVNGAAVAKNISFLKDKLHKKVFGDSINVIDRYAIPRGLRSRPLDSEGLACTDNSVIKNGVLNLFLLNTKYANLLQMTSTRNAEGFEGISPHNIYIENGKNSFSDLLKSVKYGLYVVEVMGNGLNLVTGNYSQGAVGFLIENGEITSPVNEITIAGNFLEMFSRCLPASDLKMEFGIDSPTLLIDEIVVGGN